MPRLVHRLPKYRKHVSGQAIVTLDGKDRYLGIYGSKASKAEYDRQVGEWQANGRRVPGAGSSSDLTVAQLLASFWTHAQTYYRKPDGTATSELKNFRGALKPLRRLYGDTQAAAFGPLALKAVIDDMIRLERVRTRINRDIGRIKNVWKWAVSCELVPAAAYHALQAVQGLRAGRTEAKESAPVKPVPQAQVDALRDFLGPQVWAAAQLQGITGMRAGEVLSMRPIDIDMTTRPWLYVPAQHKNTWRGQDRTVYLNREAQEVLKPFLAGRRVDAFLFSPAESEAQRRAIGATARKTPLSCGNKAGTNRKKKPRRTPGERYTVESYDHAIKLACDRAFPPPEHLAKQKGETSKAWMVRLTDEQRTELKAWRKSHRFRAHQLRHLAATRFRREHGLEVARVLLGHRSVIMSNHYAEQDLEAARRVMSDVG